MGDKIKLLNGFLDVILGSGINGVDGSSGQMFNKGEDKDEAIEDSDGSAMSQLKH